MYFIRSLHCYTRMMPQAIKTVLNGAKFSHISNSILSIKTCSRLNRISLTQFSFFTNSIKIPSLKNWKWNHLIASVNKKSLIPTGMIAFSAGVIKFETVNEFVHYMLNKPESEKPGSYLIISEIDYEKLSNVFTTLKECFIKKDSTIELNPNLQIVSQKNEAEVASLEASMVKYKECLEALNSEFEKNSQVFKTYLQAVKGLNPEYITLYHFQLNKILTAISAIWAISPKVKASTEQFFRLMSEENPPTALNHMKQIYEKNPHLNDYFKRIAIYTEILNDYYKSDIAATINSQEKGSAEK